VTCGPLCSAQDYFIAGFFYAQICKIEAQIVILSYSLKYENTSKFFAGALFIVVTSGLATASIKQECHQAEELGFCLKENKLSKNV